MSEKLGRFNHHPDPAIDFCVEVEEIESEWHNIKIGFTPGTPTVEQLRVAVERAMQFKVGGDIHAMAAKRALRKVEEEMVNHRQRNADEDWPNPLAHMEPDRGKKD